MPLSRLPDRHYLSNVLPPLEHRQSFGWDWDSVVPASSSAKNSHTPGSHRPEEGEADFSGRHGLQTPPRDMNGMSGMNGNPLLAPDAENIHYNRVPVVASNAPPYQAFNSTLSNEKQAGNRQPFYNTYYSARRPSSPPPKKDNPISNEHSARRQASSDSNSIASHLQIPASINDSKGSLPEFAAQVRTKSSP